MAHTVIEPTTMAHTGTELTTMVLSAPSAPCSNPGLVANISLVLLIAASIVGCY